MLKIKNFQIKSGILVKNTFTMSQGDDDAWLYGDDDSKGGAVEPPGAEEDAPAPAETITEAGDADNQPGGL